MQVSQPTSSLADSFRCVGRPLADDMDGLTRGMSGPPGRSITPTRPRRMLTIEHRILRGPAPARAGPLSQERGIAVKLRDYAERGDLQLEIPLLTRQLEAAGAVEQAALAWADGLVHRYLVACDLALFDFRLSLDEGTPSASFELHMQVIPWRGLEIDLAAEEKGPLESSASDPAWTPVSR